MAVLGSNLRTVYPAEHRGLAERIAEQGAVVSEFSSRCPTVPGNFPRRNRIIAGLSRGVLVVQAGVNSGALRTADWALELGLDVWAIPGEISDPLREGCHRLIKQGAQLVTDPLNSSAKNLRRERRSRPILSICMLQGGARARSQPSSKCLFKKC